MDKHNYRASWRDYRHNFVSRHCQRHLYTAIVTVHFFSMHSCRMEQGANLQHSLLFKSDASRLNGASIKRSSGFIIHMFYVYFIIQTLRLKFKPTSAQVQHFQEELHFIRKSFSPPTRFHLCLIPKQSRSYKGRNL